MATLVPFVLLSAFLFCVQATEDNAPSLDPSFCYGGLEVDYPELNINKCLVMPKNFREKLTTVWRAPQIFFPEAKKEKAYVLVMVDPDAPTHHEDKPAFYWRHWLVVDIQSQALKEGKIQGKTLTEYYPPGPPLKTGFHRYQFMLFEQHPDASLSLSQQEEPRAKWSLQGFITKFALGKPVAELQFLTQNYKD
ncbi:phosphatidylethanolamine-binding protein 4 [Mugil cephalus]|uniref:phosphatidylethanolamine-binding protein 4 n=1 Tax=Mugil cephalus TaxID=48193 RepID=UPI001FB68F52|nr:phosphatidylethanolamine-binding protein 4 [Mugil cephalus]